MPRRLKQKSVSLDAFRKYSMERLVEDEDEVEVEELFDIGSRKHSDR